MNSQMTDQNLNLVIECQNYNKGRLPSKFVFHQRSSSIKDRLPSKFVFHQRSSSIKGRLPSKVVFYQRQSSIKGCLASKVVFHQRMSCIKGYLPSKVIFHHVSPRDGERPAITLRFILYFGVKSSYIFLPCLGVENLGQGSCCCQAQPELQLIFG